MIVVPQFKSSNVFQKINNTRNKIVINRGGTSSTKTYSTCQILASWLATGNIRNQSIQKGIASVVRQHTTTIRTSVLRDFQEIVETTPLIEKKSRRPTGKTLSNIFQFNKSDRFFKFNNRVVEFFGADNYNKSKGPRRAISYFNEADEIQYSVFRQMNLRTRNISFIDFNPDDEDVWINQDLELKRKVIKKDVDVIVSTYKDNPFLSSEEVEEIEYLKNEDPMLWQIFGLGGYGKIQGLVFEHNVISEIPEGAKLLGNGLDFGFTNDPTALIAVYICHGEIYLDELIYERGLLNSDIISNMRDLNITESEDIVADSAEPKSIKEIQLAGFNCIPAVKGPDSINYGISLMKQYKINITERSLNLRKEFKKYKWKETISGKRLNKPIDAFNHGIDAVRYEMMHALGKKESGPTYNLL